MAGVGWNVRVLPVRVLGKCGGFDSDVIAGMRWAVGLPVAGVPVNPNARARAQPQPGGRGCLQRGVSRRGGRGQRTRRRGRGGRGQQRRSCGEHAGQLCRRHRRGGTAARRNQSRLFRSRARSCAERSRGELRRRRVRGSLSFSDPDDIQCGNHDAAGSCGRRLDLHGQLQRFRGHELFGTVGGGDCRLDAVGATGAHAVRRAHVAAGHGTTVSDHGRRQRGRHAGAAMHGAAIQRVDARRPVAVLLHDDDLRGRDARCRRGGGRGAGPEGESWSAREARSRASC